MVFAFGVAVLLGISASQWAQMGAQHEEVMLAELGGNNTSHSTLTEVILHPHAMYAEYGFMQMPILVMTLKSFLNFAIQMALFFGTSLLSGKVEMKKKAEDGMRFSPLSILFQIFGQAAAVAAYSKLAMVTKPWESFDNWHRYSFLLSQHSATATVLVGLANNMAVTLFYKHTEERAYNEGRAAKYLVVTGLVVATPLWVTWLTACWSTGLPVLALAAAIALLVMAKLRQGKPTIKEGVAAVFRDIRGDDGPYLQFSNVAFLVMCTTLGLATLWLLAAVDSKHAWMLFGATLLELFVPLIALMIFVGGGVPGGQEEGVSGMVRAFWVAVSLTYIVSLTVPFSLLAATDEVGLRMAAPETFWARKIDLYVTSTFLRPAERAADQAQGARAAFSLWLTQLLGFVS